MKCKRSAVVIFKKEHCVKYVATYVKVFVAFVSNNSFAGSINSNKNIQWDNRDLWRLKCALCIGI